ncbi:MAG: glycosyltransferase family 9 protein [Chthoniobacterales bacterium]|nr:glycosyltransferase family 9 protein [Chthoniobacterales bacterium]
MKPRLLVVELHHLGDAVLSLPFIRGAARTHEVHVLARPATRGIYELLADPPKVHTWEPPWADGQDCSASSAISAARIEGQVLRPLELDAAACVWADTRAEVVMAETRARQRIGFPMTRENYYATDIPWRRQRRLSGRLLEMMWSAWPGCHPLLTVTLQRETPNQSHLRCWEQIADALGISCDFSTPWFPASTRSAHTGKPVLAIHAHARLPSKQWPLDRWKQLLSSAMVREKFSLVEILPPGAEPAAPDSGLTIRTPTISDLVAALDAADFVLCHDSLPAHLGAALGKPVVSIFGSGEPDWFAPWQNRDRVVQRRVCPLHPCIDHCGMDRYLCLESIPVDDVATQLLALPRHP